MGTKNNPGKFDCYANAEPDEPMFVLLGRDPLAPFLVSLWSKIRMGDAEAAFAVFQKMRNEMIPRYDAAPDVTKAVEAMDCSIAMFKWRPTTARQEFKEAVMAPKEKIEANADLVLWCVHVLGPDDIHAAPCHDAAVVRARELNEAIHSRRDSPRDILCFAYAAPWPHTPKSHADNLKQQEVDGSPPLHPRGEGGMKGYWSVTVRLDGDEVITIEPCMLAGRDINLDDESVIRTAAHHLLSFIGDPCPATQHREGG